MRQFCAQVLTRFVQCFGMRPIVFVFSWAQLLFGKCVGLTGGAQRGPWPSMVIHTVGSKSYQYNLNGKETTGLYCPCFTMLESWHLACVWGPKLQFSQFPCSSLWLLKGWVRWIIQRMYSKSFFYTLLMLLSLSSKRHVSLRPCCVPPGLCVVVFCSFMYPLCVTDHTALSFLPSFLPSSLLHFPTGLPFACIVIVFCFYPFITSLLFLHSFPSPRRSPIPLCVALICVIASFLPTAHPLLHKWELGEQRGECHAGPREQGLNEATLNEFTAFHGAAPFPCCGPAPRPLSHWDSPHLCWGISDTCLSDTSVISCHYCGK